MLTSSRSRVIDSLERNGKDYAYFYMGSREVQSASGLVLALLEQLCDEGAPLLSLRRRDAKEKGLDVLPERAFVKNDTSESTHHVYHQQGGLNPTSEDAVTNELCDEPVRDNVDTKTLAPAFDTNARTSEGSTLTDRTSTVQREPVTITTDLASEHRGAAEPVHVEGQYVAARSLSDASLSTETKLHRRVEEPRNKLYDIPGAVSQVVDANARGTEAAEVYSGTALQEALPSLPILLDELCDRRNFRSNSTSQPFIIIDAWDHENMDSNAEFRQVIETLALSLAESSYQVELDLMDPKSQLGAMLQRCRSLV